MNSKITVYDVAKAAGVSRGTVDRVVYGRGRVSEETARKVEEVIRRLGYKANPGASMLAMKRVRRIAYLIPSSNPGEYWDLIDKGFSMDVEPLLRYNIEILPFYYDMDDVGSFAAGCDEVLSADPDGVITNEAPKEVLQGLVEQLKRRNVPLAFIDTKYDDVDYMMYCGVDAYKSGELGAFLLTMRQNPESVAIVSVERGKSASDASATRKRGVADYLSRQFKDCKILDVFIEGTLSEHNDGIMDAFAAENPGVRHFICPNSRLYLIAGWLGNHPDGERIVVGYDDLDNNLKALKAGVAEFLVTRKVPEQSRLLLSDFADSIIHGDKPVKKNRYVHMDILHRMNLDDYR